MSNRSSSRGVWARVEERVADSPMARSFVSQLRETLSDGFQGEHVTDLGERSKEALVTSVVAEIEYLCALKRVEHAKKSLAHALDALSIQVYEDEGLDLNDGYRVDPEAAAVQRQEGHDMERGSDNCQQAVNQFCGLISEARDNVVTALRMSRDDVLPPWLRELARVLSRTDGDAADILAPRTRDLLQEWLEHPIRARQWAETMNGSCPAFLLQAARVMGLRNHRGYA